MERPKGQTRRKKFTYGDYLTWPEDERWEILDGEPFDMTTAPTPFHQEISHGLEKELGRFFEDHPCRLYHAPCEVLLPKMGESEVKTRTIVQPDIFVLCDLSKRRETNIIGAPDFIIEILSPSTASRDHVQKRRIYERHGVREFWLVHPVDRTVMVYRQGRDRQFEFGGVMATDGLKLDVAIFPGLTVDFDRIFPPLLKVVRESPRKYL